MINCCKDCQNRTVGCHGTCTENIRQKEEHIKHCIEIEEIRTKERHARDYVIAATRQMKKSRKTNGKR